MKLELSLFGAFRAFDSNAKIMFELAEGASIADLRAAVQAYGLAHWPEFKSGLLARSVFASEHSVLRDSELIPPEGRMAVLPPVSGG